MRSRLIITAVSLALGAGIGAAAIKLPRSSAVTVAAGLLFLLVAMFATSRLRLTGDAEPVASPALRFGYICGFAGLAAITLIAIKIHGSLEVADTLLVVSGALLAMVAVVERREMTVAPASVVIAGAVLLLSGCIAAIADVNGGIGPNLVKAAEFSGALIATPLVLGALSASPRRMRIAGFAWTLSVVINGVVAVLDYGGHSHIGQLLAGRAYAGRQTGLTLQPNDLGIVAAMVIPYALAQVTVVARRPRERLYYAFVMVVAAAAIMISGSRAALLAAIAVLVLAPIVSPPMRSRASALLIGLVAAGPVMILAGSVVSSKSLAALNRLTTLSSASSAANSTRVFRYTSALSDAAAHPLTGVGFSIVRYATDIYLQVLQAGGVLALVAFVWFIGGTFRLGVRYCREFDVSAPQRVIATALMLSFSVWLIEGVVQNDIYNRYLFVPVGLLLGSEFIRRNVHAPSVSTTTTGMPQQAISEPESNREPALR